MRFNSSKSLLFFFSALKPAVFRCFDRVCHTFNDLNGLIIEGLLDLQLFLLNSGAVFLYYKTMDYTAYF